MCALADSPPAAPRRAHGLAFLLVLLIGPLASARAQAPVHSDRLVLDEAGGALFVVNPDSASVSRVALEGHAASEHEVCRAPQSVALDGSGARLLVTCREAGSLCVLDAAAPAECRMLAVGHRPQGVAVSSDGRVLVANQGDGSLVIVDAELEGIEARLELGGTPRAIAIAPDGARAFVTHFLTTGTSARISAIDLRTLAIETLELAEDPGPDAGATGRGFPNLLSVLRLSPDGRRLWAGGLKSNTSRGEHVSGEPLTPAHRTRGLFAPLDVQRGEDLIAERIDTLGADSVSGAAFSPDGRLAYLVHQGAATLSVYELSSPARLRGRVELGHAPQGIALASDGRTAYVMAYLEFAVQVVDLTDPDAPELVTSIRVTDDPLSPRILHGKRLFFRSRAPVHSAHGTIACASCHPDGGHDGRVWDFTQAGEGLRNTIDLRGRAGMAHGPVHWSANFNEIEDFENDIVHAFGGTGLAMDGAPPNEPLSSSPNSGRSEALENLSNYVWSLIEFPRSPHRRSDGTLTDAAVRGRAIFYEPHRRCAECHPPPRMTDSQLGTDSTDFVLHDVGTLGPGSGGRLGGPLPGIDTPTLGGLWAGAPYLHDGSAATLREVLVERNAGDAHGVTSDLADAELDDLIAFLLALDGGFDVAPPGWRPPAAAQGDAGTTTDAGATATVEAAPLERRARAHCGCRAIGRPGAGAMRAAWVLLVCVVLVLAQRRHRPRTAWRKSSPSIVTTD